MIKPIFVSAITSGIDIIQKNFTDVIRPSICSKSTIDKVIPLLIGVVEEGTAKNIKTSKYKIAGKTGTTVLNYTKRKKDEKKRYQASFVGFFPADKPRYSCIVVVNNPRKNGHYGSKVAAPIFRELADKVYASDVSIHNPVIPRDELFSLPLVKQGRTYEASFVLDKLGISTNKTEGEWMVSETKKFKVDLLLRNIENDLQNGTMPDLRGMNLQDAIFLLEDYGLVVRFQGKGSVSHQSINKGARFNKGTTINLKLI